MVSNLISLIGLRSPTADLSTEAAWAAVVFTMITAQKIKTNGVGGYLKGFTTPIPVMTPFNILSELATPISMACRHFGNILSGVVINALIYGALALASRKLLGLFREQWEMYFRRSRCWMWESPQYYLYILTGFPE